MLEALTFDVTGTLIHSPRLGALYAEVLNRHGIAVEPAAAARLVRQVWRRQWRPAGSLVAARPCRP